MPREKSPTIGAMTRSDLARFVSQAINNTPATLPPSLTQNELEATDLLTVSGDVVLSDKAVATLKVYLGL
jgi:hypothetical protein